MANSREHANCLAWYLTNTQREDGRALCLCDGLLIGFKTQCGCPLFGRLPVSDSDDEGAGVSASVNKTGGRPQDDNDKQLQDDEMASREGSWPSRFLVALMLGLGS